MVSSALNEGGENCPTISPSDDKDRSPFSSWIQIELSCTPMEVIMERPSFSTATPSASMGPVVIGSGSPPENRWRHKRLFPSTAAVRYIHAPSGDQPA